MLTRRTTILIFLLLGCSICTEVNISLLSSAEAHSQSFVNTTYLNDPALQSITSYSGYITVDPSLTNNHVANYFFWFIESTQSSKSGVDIPIIIWLQGGPGCSSMVGLFLEMGPFKIKTGGSGLPLNEQLYSNPFAWTNEFHMLFVDNPVGSGFSYGNVESYVTSSNQMATYLENVVSQFMDKFPEYKPNPFYVFGESYGGKFSVVFSSTIMNSSINFSGFAVGNSFTDPYSQIGVQADVLFSLGFADKFQADEVRVYQNNIREYIDNENWIGANNERSTMYHYIAAITGGINMYDYRTYQQMDYNDLIQFLNQPAIRILLHAAPVGRVIFEECNSQAKDILQEDIMQSVSNILPELLNNYPGLFYQGIFDLVDGVPATEAMLSNLNWSGIQAFQSATRKIWHVNDSVSGMVKSYLNLNQCTVLNAGHLVPMDQGEASFDMAKRFIYKLDWE